MKQSIGWSSVLCLLGLAASRAAAQLPSGNWALRYADEFNETYSGNAMGLDPDKWSPAYPWGRTHNYPAYIRDENIAVNAGGNGLLQLASKRENFEGQPFTSGAVNTSGLLNFTQGYMEARMRLPSYLGAWPAFWGLSDGWPPEIDMMEARFRSDTAVGYDDMYRFLGNYHFRDGSGNATSNWTDFQYTGHNLTAGFHNYGTLWEPTRLTWTIDGVSIGSYNGTAATISQMQNMYLLLNLGVGGWPGDPPSWENVNKSFDIDWVRIWQLSGTTATNWNGANGYQQWDTNSNWTANSPQLANQKAVFRTRAGITGSTLDWNGTKTISGLTFRTNASYQVGFSDDQLMLSTWTSGSTSDEALIDLQVDTASATQGTQSINARVELYSNTRVKNATTNTLTFGGEIHGAGSLTLDSGKTNFLGVVKNLGGVNVVGSADASFTNTLDMPATSIYVGTTSGSNSVARFVRGPSVNANHIRVADAGGAGTFNAGTSIINVTAGEVWVGQGAGSSGTWNQDGGSITVNNWLAIGRQNGTGVYNLNGGTIVKKGAGHLIIGSLGGVGTLNQNGGTVDVQVGDTYLGEDSGALGTYNLNAGTAFLHNLNLSQRNLGSGTFNLNGGTATVLSIRRNAGGMGLFKFDGGTLRAAQSTAIFMQGLSGAVVANGGAKIDSDGFEITIGQQLSGPGALTKVGTGTLKLTASNDYLGGTTVNGGTLLVANANALGGINGGGVQVAGGKLLLDANLATAVVTPSLDVSNTGTVEINRAGLILDYAVTTPVDEIVADLAAGRIVSSLTASDGRLLVGYLDTAMYGAQSFGGVNADATAILLKTVLSGDANLDAAVGFDDLLVLAQHYDGAGYWADGDFNYDRVVNFDDLLTLAQNYNSNYTISDSLIASGGESFVGDWWLAQALVPEPTAIALLGGAALAGRRRRS